MKWLNDYRLRLMLTGCIISGFLGSVCSAVEYVWRQKADMPTPRWNLATCVVDGKIYALGGERSEGGEGNWRLSAMEEYDPLTNTWTVKTDIPNGRVASSTSVVGGKIYAIGGRGGSSNLSRVEEYDPVTDTWATKADMTTPRWMLSTCVVDGKIYAVGGTPKDNWSGLTTVEVYDPSTDSWAQKADMPFGVWGLCAHVVSGKIYALGGRPGLQAIPYVQEYDPATDTWTRKADMAIGTSQMASVVLGDKIIVVGGWLWSANFPYTAVQIYDPATDTWTIKGDAPFLRAAVSASVVNNRMYVIGGTDRPHPCPAMSTVFEFGPLHDFNWDGIVDSSDMCKLIDYWQTDNPLYDIAPLPFGDGIVDIQDLTELSEHLFEEISPLALIGHWKLDEDEGDIAYNSISDNHGILSGNPIWQPEGGIVDGSLQFDGIDDYVSTEFVLNPTDGKFSVIAWVKDGAPGQVILSQERGAHWLMTDRVDGALKTDLKEPGTTTGRNPIPPGPPLTSSIVVTDGDWHRMGFVWDGSYRHLYVDSVEVGVDVESLSGLESAEGGLYFGDGSTLAPDSFFSGLIDDVRIYNRVVSP